MRSNISQHYEKPKPKRKKVSLRKAINEMCKDCTYDPLCPGTWRRQVEECECKLCPLWPVRPVTTGGKQNADAPIRE